MNHLLTAKGIAIVGANEKRYYPRSIIHNLLLLGYPKEWIYPINPNYPEVMGMPCYRSMAHVPSEIQLAVLVTNKDTVPQLLMEAKQCGIRNVVVLADGFAEQGDEGRALQRRITEIAEEAQISILGPNTLGFIVPEQGIGIWAGGELHEKVRPGNMALVFQSSGMLNLALSLVLDRNIGLRAGVSVGNEAVMDTADFIEHFAKDAGTSVIGVFLESSLRPAKLARALALAHREGKPVIMLKVGRSERARRNAVAHTGRMASSGHAWEALLKRLGVILARDFDEFIETLVLFQHRKDDLGNAGLGIATISGGDCSLLSDLAEELKVALPDVQPGTKQILIEALEKPSLLGNPLDCENLRRENPEQFQRCIEALCQDPSLQIIAFRMNLAKSPNAALKEMYSSQLIPFAKKADKMAVVLSRANETLDSEWFRFFEEQGVAFLPSYYTALRAIRHLQNWSTSAALHSANANLPGIPVNVLSESDETEVLSWKDTQSLLQKFNIPYVPSFLAQTPQEAAQFAESLGFPVVIKLTSPSMPHKSEMNAVQLNVKTSDEVVKVCERIQTDFRSQFPGMDAEGFEVQKMVVGGTEIIIGMTTDQSIGPVVLVGGGGIFTEVLHDVILAVPPLNEQEASSLLDELKISALLKGIRGKPPLDREALSKAIASFSQMVVEQRHTLKEIDLNPVMVMPEGQGVMAVDALINIKKGV